MKKANAVEIVRWTAAELRKLPPAERDAIMEAAAVLAEEEYRNNPESTVFEAVGKDNGVAGETNYGRTTTKKLTDQSDIKRFLRASEAYFSTGICSVKCDRCGLPIVFQKIGSQAWKHECSCGKYNGTLRGL